MKQLQQVYGIDCKLIMYADFVLDFSKGLKDQLKIIRNVT